MTESILLLSRGLFPLPWWAYVAIALVSTQITIAAVTLFLHRAQAHKAIELHPLLSHFFRFWLWLTTGMITREWVAIHRKHHAYVETERDPHSPQTRGIRTVLWRGAELYMQEAGNRDTIERFGRGTPDDWLERNLYARFSLLGVSLLLIVELALFGFAGIAIWGVQMLWIPFWAAGVINGLGHYWGYRNYETDDASRNLVPVALFIGGEELHNNHHAYAGSARFSLRPWELDIGWLYIRTLRLLRLAQVRREAPHTVVVAGKTTVDSRTIQALIRARLQVSADYAHRVVAPVLREELRRADRSYRRLLKRGGRMLLRNESRLDAANRERRDRALASSRSLRQVYEFQRQLQAIWERAPSQAQVAAALQEWCTKAEASGSAALEAFAQRLKGYELRPN